MVEIYDTVQDELRAMKKRLEKEQKKVGKSNLVSLGK